jgi:hypothetical protein
MTMVAKPRAEECDLFSNERFAKFRAMLEAKGYFLKLMWSCRSGAHNPETGKQFKYDDIGMFVVCGQKRPKVSTLIVQNYGQRDGFGLWFDSQANGYEADVATITGE